MERRRMDAEGGRVVHRRKRTRRLAIVMAVQNVLVTACLAVTLYVCWDFQSRSLRVEPAFGNNIHIEFSPISDIEGNATLVFTDVHTRNAMSLADTPDKININCSGPYVLYVHLCYRPFVVKEATGTLQLRAGETNFTFPTLHVTNMVCRGLQDIVFFNQTGEASLHLISSPGFKIKTLTVGLSYLLGSRCISS